MTLRLEFVTISVLTPVLQITFVLHLQQKIFLLKIFFEKTELSGDIKNFSVFFINLKIFA